VIAQVMMTFWETAMIAAVLPDAHATVHIMNGPLSS